MANILINSVEFRFQLADLTPAQVVHLEQKIMSADYVSNTDAEDGKTLYIEVPIDASDSQAIEEYRVRLQQLIEDVLNEFSIDRFLDKLKP
jgi:hypothetical protein